VKRLGIKLTVAVLLTAFLLLMVLSILIGPLGFHPGTSIGSLVIKHRVMRTLLALSTGGVLALAGMLVQYSVSNPLASPDLLGVLQGAYAGSMLAVIAYRGSPPFGLPLTAGFVGGLLAYALTMMLASRIGFSRAGVVLAGITVASLFSGVSAFIALLAEAYAGVNAAIFLVGTFAYATQESVAVAFAGLALGVIASSLIARGLDMLSYGDEVALAAGYNPAIVRIVATSTAALLSAVSVYASGIVYFVALVAPNAARILVGGHPKRSLPVTLLLGSLIGVGADVVSRVVALTTRLGEVPGGLVTAITGSIFLAYMLVRMGASSGFDRA
jgi:iron complex transport system permease protein